MAKFILTTLLEFLVGLTLITQVIIPIFLKDTPFFWLFRSSKKEEEEQPVSSGVQTLDDLEKEALAAKKQFENSKKKIYVVEEKISDIKSKL